MNYRQDWQEDYKRKLVSAKEAVKVVKSGDLVAIPLPIQPRLLPPALAARKDELRNVTILSAAPAMNPGWYSAGMEESFTPVIELFLLGIARPSHDERRTAYLPDLFSLRFKGLDEGRPEARPLDVLMTLVSPPDKFGFCSFGHSLWHKRSYARRAKKVIAEVDETQIRTGGTNFIHVSQIDYLVEHTPPELTEEEIQDYVIKVGPEKDQEFRSRAAARVLDPGTLRMVRPLLPYLSVDFVLTIFGLDDPDEAAKGIAENLKALIKNGDTLQIGVGRPSKYMPKLGVFDNFVDLGLHTEMGSPGLGVLVREGVITGKHKTLHPGKAIFSTLIGCDAEDMGFITDNPIFEQYDSEYVVDIRTVCRHDNMVAINNGLQIDLTGQITSETQFGPRIINGQGGQTEMHIGALYSKGGRAITLLPSTALKGAASTIVPQLDTGSLVTIPRQLADTVVTEYGVARLHNKDHRQRAEELISVAHPDFRAELRKEAQRLFYP